MASENGVEAEDTQESDNDTENDSQCILFSDNLRNLCGLSLVKRAGRFMSN